MTRTRPTRPTRPTPTRPTRSRTTRTTHSRTTRTTHRRPTTWRHPGPTRRTRPRHPRPTRKRHPHHAAGDPRVDGRGAAMADERDDDKGSLTDALPMDALKDAGQHLLGLLIERVTEAATQQVSGLADRLTDVTASGGNVRAALVGGNSQTTDQGRGETGDDSDGPGGVQGALSKLKEKVTGAFSGDGGGGGGGGGATKLKMTNIVESQDIGPPLRNTY